jgi:CRP-like cAMP-binding protein
MTADSTQTLMTALRRVQFLNSLSEELLHRLIFLSRIVSFPSGSLVFRQGAEAKSLYLIVEGSVALEICAAGVGCKRILTVNDGELLGWSPALGEPRMTATARALTDVVAVELDGEECVSMCENEPRLGYEFMKRTAKALAKRLNATRLQLLNVYSDSLPQVPDERVVQ